MSVTLECIAPHEVYFAHSLQWLGKTLLEDFKELGHKKAVRYDGSEKPDDAWHSDILYYEDEGVVHIEMQTNTEFGIDLFPFVAIYNNPFKRFQSLFSAEATYLGYTYEMRKDLYELMRVLRSDEVIYLPDNFYKLATYYENDALSGKSYYDIKEKMTKELGSPVIGYTPENAEKVYNSDTVWMVDDFADIKPLYSPLPEKNYHLKEFGMGRNTYYGINGYTKFNKKSEK
jgi:hypothetical protein